MTPEEAQRLPALIPIKFWTAYEEVEGKPGDPRAVDWVTLVKKGSNGQSRDEKVARITKNEKDVWALIERPYEAWKKGQEEPVDGAPLSTWPGVNQAMADRLRLMHLRTVEDVANVTEADFDRIGMGARQLRDKARAFMANKDAAVVAEAIAAKDKQIADLTAQLADLTETVKALAADRPKRDKPTDYKTKAA